MDDSPNVCQTDVGADRANTQTLLKSSVRSLVAFVGVLGWVPATIGAALALALVIILTFGHLMLGPSLRGDAYYAVVTSLVLGFGFALAWLVRDRYSLKHFQEVLRETELKYKHVFHASKDALIVVHASSGRIVDVNDSAVAIYGYSIDEFKRLSVYEISNEPEKTRESIERASVGRFTNVARRMHRKKDGAVFQVEIAGGTFVLNGEKYIIGGIRDITEHLKIHENLRLARFSLDYACDPAFWFTHEGAITYTNEAACHSLGYSREELTKLTVYDITPKLTPASWAKAWEGVMQGDLSTYESQHRRKDGSEFLVEKTAKILNYDGRENMCVFSRDITMRKENDRALEQYAADLEDVRAKQEVYAKRLERLVKELQREKQRAEQAVQAKTEFLANVSHELRTPMTAILGFSEILSSHVGEDPKSHEATEIIKRNGEYLLQLLDDILDLSKIEVGKLDLHRSRCCPYELVTEVISLMRVRAEAKGLQLQSVFHEGLPTSVVTDPLRLRQVLINLISNAIKFTEVGKVTVDIKYIAAQDAVQQSFLQLSVSDTGIGMSAEEMQYLYQPFRQHDSSTTRRFGGSGLGLAISQRFARLLGGELVARSEVNQGSVFTVTVAAGKGSEPAGGFSEFEDRPQLYRLHNQHEVYTFDTAAYRKPLGGYRILLVEDGPDNQKLFEHFLEKSGAQVAIAANGQEALDKICVNAEAAAGQPTFDLVLMDIQMPILDGYAATRILRERGFRKPIIALTAHAMSDEGQRCLDAGCSDLITKPTFEKPFIQTIVRYITSSGPGEEMEPKVDSPLNAEKHFGSLASDPVFADLVAKFVGNLPARVEAISAALARQDYATVRSLAHQLAGACGGYGFPEITKRAQQVERSAKEDSAEASLHESFHALQKVCISAGSSSLLN